MSSAVVVALDFETADGGADSACALGMVRIRDGVVEKVWLRLIRPPRRRVYFTAIHGITWPMVKNCPPFAALWPECASFWDGASHFIAHNAAFDRHILRGCCTACGITPPAMPFLCTLKGARKNLALPRYRLNNVCEHLHIDLQHHNAASDALAAARIYLYLIQHGMSVTDMLLDGNTAPAWLRLPGCPA